MRQGLYPAAAIIGLYHERWEIELAYDEIKTHQLDRLETIRSRSVKGVEQELWGILLTFNLVRLEMAKMAEEADVLPSPISFITAMRFIRDEWGWCAVASPGSIPEKLRRMRANVLDFVLSERRRERRFPRAVKIKMSNYAQKRRQAVPKVPANGAALSLAQPSAAPCRPDAGLRVAGGVARPSRASPSARRRERRSSHRSADLRCMRSLRLRGSRRALTAWRRCP